jgi:sulfur-oxidizing protein SoxZ
MYKTRIAVPATARPGEIIEIRTLISHPMESGFRRGPDGALIPRNILRSFSCTYLGEPVFGMDFFPGVAANPFLSFHLRATESGEVHFEWIDQDGKSTTASATLTVRA